MMKARSYNRRALTKGISNNLSVVEESNSIDKFICDDLTNDSEQNKIGEYLVDVYRDAQEIGTLQTVEARDYASFIEYLKSVENITYQIEISTTAWINDTLPKMIQLAKQAEIMSEKYAVVCTNPPYMNKLEGQLKKFVVDNYKAYSGDLFSVFMYRNFGYCKTEGYSAFMTPNVWMFIKTYENLRKYIINNKHITTLIQMAKGAFFKEATVDIASFVLKNSKCDKHGLYFRLEDFKGDMEVQKQKVLEALTNKDCGYFYEADQSNFSKIPGSSIAYWVSDAFVKVFKYGKPLEKEAYSFQGIITGNNNYFLRLWHEVSLLKVKVNICNQEKEKFNNAWVPYNKGGGFRRWYGNNEYLLRWIDNGKTLTRARTENSNFYFQEGVTWSFVTSGVFSARYFPQGALWDVAGSSIFATKKLDIRYICALMNSKPAQLFFDITNPTINYQVMNIIALPLLDNIYIDEVVNLSKKCIELSKTDWDSYETSWDFKKHPLLCYGTNTVSSAFENWTNECNDRFNQLKANEEELNRIFIDIYGLQDELTPEVEDKDVTVRKADLQRDIKSLISYAVGCMLGRYSLDIDGLAYAGGEWDDSKYQTFIPDEDNCIPITDEEYFEDDIVGLFCAWLKKVYGEDTLEENLDFIANALGNKGKTNREVIRNYFLNGFIKDHIKTYQKRPIYWLFDSGKQNGFKALVYMHRWNADTTGNMRVEYLHRMQRVYEKEIERMQEIIDNSHDNKEISNATKRKEKLQKQIKEIKDYDAKIAHLALSRIDIDLDDGVKVNYEKVQTVDGEKMQILAKI